MVVAAEVTRLKTSRVESLTDDSLGQRLGIIVQTISKPRRGDTTGLESPIESRYRPRECPINRTTFLLGHRSCLWSKYGGRTTLSFIPAAPWVSSFVRRLVTRINSSSAFPMVLRPHI